MAFQTTLDLEEQIADLRDERLDDVEADQADIVEEASALSPPAGEDEQERLDELEQEFDALEEARVTMEGYISALEAVIDEWGGSEFVIQELTAGETRRIRDEVTEKSGEDSYRDGYHELQVVEAAIVDGPPAAPTKREGSEEVPDPTQYPDRVFNWLYGRINAFTTVGEFDLGNSSLQDRIRQHKSGKDEPTSTEFETGTLGTQNEPEEPQPTSSTT